MVLRQLEPVDDDYEVRIVYGVVEPTEVSLPERHVAFDLSGARSFEEPEEGYPKNPEGDKRCYEACFGGFGKPNEPLPAVGLGIRPDHQAISLSCSSQSSKTSEGVSPPSDPWGRSSLYS